MRGGYSLPSSTSIYSELCWNCIRKQRANAHRGASLHSVKTNRKGGSIAQRKSIHGSTYKTGKSSLAGYTYSSFEEPTPPPSRESKGPRIREQLEKWQEEHGNPLSDLVVMDVMGRHTTPMPDNYRRPKRSEDGGETLDDDNDIPETSTLQNTEEISVAKGRWYNPGDLVELWESTYNGSPNLAVYVKAVNDSQCQVITSRGKWMNSALQSFQYTLPKFLPREVIDPVIPYIPSEEVMEEYLDQAMVFDLSVPRSVTGPIVTALNDFIHSSEDVYRTHAARLDNAHQILSHATDLRFGNLQKIAAKLLGTTDLSPAALYAVRRALLRAGIGFGIDHKSHRTTDMFQIRSQEQLQLTETVQGWLRDYQDAKVLEQVKQHSPQQTSNIAHLKAKEKAGVGIIRRFIQKCIPAIAESRKKRPITEDGFIGLSQERIPLDSEKGSLRWHPRFEFTTAERLVVRFMEYWSLQNLFWHSESLQALAPLLLRDTGMYQEQQLNRHTGLLMLQEIGVLDPFTNIALYDVDLLLPTSQHSKPLEQLASSLSSLTLEDANLEDSMAGLRHDFKDLPVFCIDSQGAGEIDDGISVDRIGDSSEEYWFHIHVANPTAFIKGNSVFAKMAAHLTESFYAPETVYPMLPRWLSDQLLSLRANRPTLTFSARVNTQGVIKDFKIQPGIIRNVITLYYEDLAGLLGLNPPPPKKSYVIGTTTPLDRDREPPPQLTEDQRDMLRIIHKVSNARFAMRESMGGLFFDAPWADISVHSKPGKYGLPPSYSHRKTTASVHGDPVIELHAREARNWFSVSADSTEHLVREMMVLACEVAGRFAERKNLPLIFRGMVQNPNAEYTPERYQRDILQPAIAKHGATPFSLGLKMAELHGTAHLSSKPLRHSLMALDHYCKVTSPLRRYGDMIAHWQIESALRHEARHGDKPMLHSDLAFTRGQIASMIGTLQPRERLISRTSKMAARHWIIQFMLRAYTFGEETITTTTTYAHAATNVPFSITTTPPSRLPHTFPVIFNSTSKFYDGARVAHGLTADMGVRVQFNTGRNIEPKEGLEWDKDFFDKIAVGDCWECMVVHVNPYTHNFEVVPLRLLRREGEGGVWL